MDSTFYQLCPRYSGTLNPTAPMAIRLWEIFTLTFYTDIIKALPYLEPCQTDYINHGSGY